MEISSSSSTPISDFTKRAIPPLKLNNHNGNNIMMELRRSLFSPTSLIRTPTFRTKRSMVFVYSFALMFIVCTMGLMLGRNHIHNSSEWLKNMLRNRELAYAKSIMPHGTHNGSALPPTGSNAPKLESDLKNDESSIAKMDGTANNNVTVDPAIQSVKNETGDHGIKGNSNENVVSTNKGVRRSKGKSIAKRKENRWLEKLSHCDIFDGKWVRDDSPPLYERGSCPHIDEPFNCYLNGRPDNSYEKYRWQPNHCDIPRLDGQKMLKFLRGKRIVYIGDSLNRNMWQSMVCLLRNAVKDKSKVFEASGRKDFKKEGAYSFLFPDYNVSVEFIRSAFLVQEWEMPAPKGSKKETLRLDLVDRSYATQKDPDVLVFNTGHWWTHEKTSQGKGYYQEGSHVHDQLDVIEAFHKAMTTWARWLKSNVNPAKTNVFLRGYSLSHFSDGEWNSGGKCNTKAPTTEEKDLLQLDQISPPIPQMLEKSLDWVQTPVLYLNVTRMTNYRTDAHPAMYRKPNMTEEEKRLFQTQQDCSHWCLPGVPDTWNQLLFAKLLVSHRQKQRH